MKSYRIQLFILFILPSLWLGTAAAAESKPVDEEMRKQEEILKSEGEKKPAGYVINRGLDDYTDAFPAEFHQRLRSLGPTDRWLDIGAGEGQAILDYYERTDEKSQGRAKAKAVAMSIEDRRQPKWYLTAAKLERDQIQYFFSKPVRQYSVAELGTFQIITDFLGGFSYTDELSLFMDKVLQLLSVKGSFYSLLQDIKSEDGSNQPYYANSPYLTEITDTAGSEVKVCSWLKRITCVEVTCELKPRWKPPVEIYRVHKVCDGVNVPALTKTKFNAGTPPERRYQLKK